MDPKYANDMFHDVVEQCGTVPHVPVADGPMIGGNAAVRLAATACAAEAGGRLAGIIVVVTAAGPGALAVDGPQALHPGERLDTAGDRGCFKRSFPLLWAAERSDR